ncbi:MOSC domain-containing protein [Yimella sp. RIT 621]|uniref:MOSC domain-containing protein n=1 Tax=unclassified Yimella TaxID=2649892 RepID=UPI001EFBC179|nr:MOSC domain-containing protein [Yimella sp. RIT 621]MCG8654681.1 MOSC domain-containing protein [Yimella sp. NH-Cas1]
MTSARILSTNVASPPPARKGRRSTGIVKLPHESIEVFAPGPDYGDGSGVVGDLVGNRKHHGGAQKAVYAYAREELDHWGRELGEEFPDGWFGENLTTTGIDLERLLINQQLRIGSALLEVSIPRSPCRTFADHLGVRGWVKRFTTHGRCGVYLRVVEPGTVRPGDPIELIGRPDHEVDMKTAFAAAMGDDDASELVVRAGCLPPMYHQRHVERLAARSRLQ